MKQFYTDEYVHELVSQHGDWAYLVEAMNRFVGGEFSIECSNSEQSWALLSAIVDTVKLCDMNIVGVPSLQFQDPATIYYVSGDTVRSYPRLYVGKLPHPTGMDTQVHFVQLVDEMPFDDKSRELLNKLHDRKERDAS